MSSEPGARPDGDPDELFARARMGDQAAWEQLYLHCYDKLRRVIRRKLDRPMLRSVYESTDFANEVFKSLVAKSGRFDFPNMAALTKYLAKAAEQKVIDEQRRIQRIKHGGGRVVHLPEDADGRTYEPASPDPTPSQMAVGREAEERLFNTDSDEVRQILELKREGYSNDEIASKTGLNLRKVQRIVKHAFDTYEPRREYQP